MGQKFDRNDDELYVGEIFAPLWQNKAFVAAITAYQFFSWVLFPNCRKIFTAGLCLNKKVTQVAVSILAELGTIAALAGLRGKKTSNSDALIERMMARSSFYQ